MSRDSEADRLGLPDLGELPPHWDVIDGMYFNRRGEAITMREWGRLHADRGYKRVAETTVGDYWISTVWIGIDHSFGGPPVTFETMVFNNRGRMLDIDLMRYSTEEQAIAGHELFVKEYTDRVNLLGAAYDLSDLPVDDR